MLLGNCCLQLTTALKSPSAQQLDHPRKPGMNRWFKHQFALKPRSYILNTVIRCCCKQKTLQLQFKIQNNFKLQWDSKPVNNVIRLINMFIQKQHVHPNSQLHFFQYQQDKQKSLQTNVSSQKIFLSASLQQCQLRVRPCRRWPTHWPPACPSLPDLDFYGGEAGDDVVTAGKLGEKLLHI